MKKKIFAVMMAAVMTLSLAACGGEQTSNDVTPTTAPTATTAPTQAPVAEPTKAPEPQNVSIADASINFEDGNYGFVQPFMEFATSAELELSVADFNGSKALKIENLNGKFPYIGIDVSSLLGANAAKVAGVEFVSGASTATGKFYAIAGEVKVWHGTKFAEKDSVKLADWSVYMEKKNPKVSTAKLSAGNEFVAEESNLLLINLKTDNGAATGENATIYLDDIRFYDKDGKTVTADTTVAFNAPEGFAGGGPDLSNLYAVSNKVEFPGFACGGDGWAQNGFEMPQEIIDALVPGSVVEINYTSEDGTMWIVMPDSAAGWMRVAQGQAYINNSKSVAQIPYEKFVELLGEDKTTWGARMQCEAQTKWEVFSVSVGTAAQRTGIANPVEFEGFACGGDGWAQNGFEVPQGIWDALVPGSIIEIDYTSEDGTLWIVMPDSAAGWMRCAQGTAVLDGSKAYITYEQIAAACGEDKSTWGARMQCEAQTKWEVYGLRVGTKVTYPAISGLTEFAGYACAGDGWAQNGAEMTPELIAALVPGAVVEISYTSDDGDIWIVMPDSAAGWMRCAQGQAAKADGKAYITYEQIAAACGEDVSTWGARMQFEGSSKWEVYGIRVGKAAGAVEVPVVEQPAAPAVADPVITVDAGKGTVVAADASWWTQIALTKEQLFAGVDEASIAGFKFSGDTDFHFCYNSIEVDAEGKNVWVDLKDATSYTVKASDIEFADDIYYACLVLSKGDSVEYNLAWEVIYGEMGTGTPEVEETPAVEETPVAEEPASTDLVITFTGLTAGGYGYDAKVNGDVVDVTIASQYQEIQYVLPEVVDLAAYKTLIVDVTSNAQIDIKLVDPNAELNQYNQLAPFKDNYTAQNSAVTEPVYIDLAEFADKDLSQINFMATGNNTTFTIKSITFVK